MGEQYSQLSIDEREMIAVLRAGGKTAREIGRVISRSHSPIVRELERNSPPVYKGYYLAHKAEERARERKCKAGERERLKSPFIRSYVKRKLESGLTPEQISGRLKIDKPDLSISHEAIYQYVYTVAPRLVGSLTRRHKKRRAKAHSRRHKKSHIPNRIGIDERPRRVDARKEFGHWGSDSLVSRASKAALNVLAERKTRYLKITKLDRKMAVFTRKTINRRLSRYPEGARLSITYDNGSENVEHDLVNETLGTQSYFCNPYHSWEKGTVENSCGLIRRYIPKKSNIAMTDVAEVKRIERILNNRPRKCLNYQTPAELFGILCDALPG